MLYYAADTFFWYKALFMTELIIAESLLISKLLPRKKLYFRIPLGLLICYGVAFMLPCTSNLFIASILFFTMFIASAVAIFVCCDTNFKSALFIALFGYAVQHIANQAYEIFLVGSGLYTGTSSALVDVGGIWNYLPFFSYGSGQVSLANSSIIIIFYLIIYLIIYFFMFLLTHFILNIEKELLVKNSYLFIISIVTIVFGILASTIVSWYSSDNLDKGYVILLDIYNILGCIFVIYLLFNSLYVKHIENDLAIVQRMVDNQEKQYQVMKDSIDLINIKAHDLKHQIRQFKVNQNLSEEQLKELEEAIYIYDSNIKTGNKALDIVLTEKNFVCTKNKISFSCIADGEAINMFSEAEIYSMFGNLLDNAIDAVKNLPTKKRIIGLNISKSKKGSFFHIYNKYEGKIKFNGNLPTTSKNDTTNHGYGMKSVHMLVEKYGGELIIKVEDGLFNVSAIFPTN